MIQRIALIWVILLLCVSGLAQFDGSQYFVGPDGDNDNS